MKISYVIGTNSYTKEVNLTSNESLEIMNKQLSLSIPLITGAKIKRKKRVKQIFVGKELSLSSLHKNNFWLQKYDLSLEEVMDIALQGYKRACLLSRRSGGTAGGPKAAAQDTGKEDRHGPQAG